MPVGKGMCRGSGSGRGLSAPSGACQGRPGSEPSWMCGRETADASREQQPERSARWNWRPRAAHPLAVQDRCAPRASSRALRSATPGTFTLTSLQLACKNASDAIRRQESTWNARYRLPFFSRSKRQRFEAPPPSSLSSSPLAGPLLYTRAWRTIFTVDSLGEHHLNLKPITPE